jgi:hypothetical protein
LVDRIAAGIIGRLFIQDAAQNRLIAFVKFVEASPA